MARPNRIPQACLWGYATAIQFLGDGLHYPVAAFEWDDGDLIYMVDSPF
jgi:hypothetical protein